MWNWESKPVEEVDFPCFYTIPWYTRYCINRGGLIIDKWLSKFVVGRQRNREEPYWLFSLMKDNGTWSYCGRHRLLLIVFDHPGIGIDDLYVNHKNGFKGDDRLENLEWVTAKGNVEHAGMMGLTEKCTPISVRNVDTGEITTYPSIIECAREMNVSKDFINYRTKIGEMRVFPERKQYRIGHADIPWYIPKNIELELMENSSSRAVLVKDLITEEIHFFPRFRQAAGFFGVTVARMTPMIRMENQPILFGRYLLKRATDTSPWREVEDIKLEIDSRGTKGAKRIIVVTQFSTGEVTEYPSARACAQAKGINPTTLDWRLKTTGKVVYPDGYTYQYYSDYLLSAQAEKSE